MNLDLSAAKAAEAVLFTPEVLPVGFVGGVPGAQKGLEQQHGQELALKRRPRVQAAQQEPREPPRPCSYRLQSCRGQRQARLQIAIVQSEGTQPLQKMPQQGGNYRSSRPCLP